MNKTTVPYRNEEKPSYDEEFLKVVGTIKRFSDPTRRRPGPKRKRKNLEKSSYNEMHYL